MSWVQTASGARVVLLRPQPEQIHLADVARHLAGQCRYMGGTTAHYSVAEHSMRVAFALESAGYSAFEVLAGLLHDAPEAFLLDLPAPLKASMPAVVRHWWDSAERRMGAAMEVAFAVPRGIITDPPKIVAEFDRRIVVNEREEFLVLPYDRVAEPGFEDWEIKPAERLNVDFPPLSPTNDVTALRWVDQVVRLRAEVTATTDRL